MEGFYLVASIDLVEKRVWQLLLIQESDILAGVILRRRLCSLQACAVFKWQHQTTSIMKHGLKTRKSCLNL